MKQNRFGQKIDLEIKNLTCVREEKPIFSNIGFQLAQGECLLLRGANGSGKSTLLLCLSEVLPYQGRIRWRLDDDTARETPVAHLVHFISGQTAMKSELTLAENLLFWSDIFGGDKTLVPGALETAGLGGLDDFSAGHLSTGQKHRLSLARLLVSERPVWLLDEPSSTLDAQGDTWVAELIGTHLKNNGMVVAATHRTIPFDDNAPVRTLTLGDS